MKLKFYSQQTFPKLWGGGGKTGLPKINFGKTGTITINKTAATLMELKGNDKITIAQDEDEGYNWYLFKDHDHGFDVRDKKAGGKSTGDLQLSHKSLLLEIFKSCDLDSDKSQSFIIAGQPTTMKGDKRKYWGLLVKSKV